MTLEQNSHPARAAAFMADDERSRFHDRALWEIRRRRDRRAQALPEWEALRGLASRIKAHTLSRLPDYLIEFEQNAQRLYQQAAMQELRGRDEDTDWTLTEWAAVLDALENDPFTLADSLDWVAKVRLLNEFGFSRRSYQVVNSD